jgi:hypothetical protein
MVETLSQTMTTENKLPLTTNIQDIEESLNDSLDKSSKVNPNNV